MLTVPSFWAFLALDMPLFRQAEERRRQDFPEAASDTEENEDQRQARRDTGRFRPPTGVSRSCCGGVREQF